MCGGIILQSTKLDHQTLNSIIKQVRLNGTVRDISFSPFNSDEMLAIGSEGEIYRYDLRTWTCVERWSDEGNLSGTYRIQSNHFLMLLLQREYHSCISFETTGTLIRSLKHGGCVAGSSSGVLNVYTSLSSSSLEVEGWGGRRTERKPKYSVMNLTTEINDFCVGLNQRVAALSSRKERDSLKLFDMRNGAVFKEWPVEKTPLGHVTSVDFDVTGKLLGVGNMQGKVLLYELNRK